MTPDEIRRDVLIAYVRSHPYRTGEQIRYTLSFSRSEYRQAKRDADLLLALSDERITTPTAIQAWGVVITQDNRVVMPGDANQRRHLLTRLYSELRHARVNLANASTVTEANDWRNEINRLSTALAEINRSLIFQ